MLDDHAPRHVPVDDGAVAPASDEMLVDVEAMYAEALAMMPDLWQTAVAAGKDPRRLALDLTDRRGRVLLSVPFSDLAQLRGTLQ